MAAAAIGPTISAAGSIGAGLLNFFSAKKSGKPGKDEAAATRTQTDASNELSTSGRDLTAYGMPKLQQAGNYFSTLAGGNRAATTQALAPEVEQINDVYGGTQRTLARFLRGPDRDYQMGELSRQRAGSIGSLFTGARERGVAGLVRLGEFGVGQGTALKQGAAGIAGDVADRAMRNRYGGAELERSAGADTAGLIFQLLRSGAFKWGKGGGSSGLPGTQIPIRIPGGGS